MVCVLPEQHYMGTRKSVQQDEIHTDDSTLENENRNKDKYSFS